MDLQSEYMEPLTPGLSYNNVGYWKTEDSGYHTSYTPGSLECSEISSENLNPIFNGFTGQCYDIQSDVNFRPTDQFSAGILRSRGNYTKSPQNRRGVKRAYNGEATSTSIIAGGLCKLRDSDKKLNGSYSSVSFDTADLFVADEKNEHTPYPSTPIKKVCRSSCKLNSPSPRKPVRKLDFTIHSLQCDAQALQPIKKKPVRPLGSAGKVYKFRPNQKVDIIKMLYQEGNVMPPIKKIFSFLASEDIFNFTLVSPLWQNVWKDVSKVKSKKQKEYLNYLKDVRDNQENKMATPKSNETYNLEPLMEIHNVLNNHIINKTTSSPVSPPGSPKSIKFKRFTKAASIDLRKQLPCARCQQPAKLTEETTGEEWAECTNVRCYYQFCRFCKCDRHQGNDCFKYDLDSPSPSKRKNSCAVASKKSRKNLKRLLSFSLL